MKYQKLFSTIGAIALALTITAGPAEAGKTDWRDSHYNFKSIQTVFVEDIDFSQADIDNDILKKRFQQYYHDQENRPKWQVLSKADIERKISLSEWQDMDTLRAKEPEKAKELWNKDLAKVVNAYVTAAVTRYEITSYIVPAHTEWETQESTDTYTDKDGKIQTIKHTYQVPVYVPDRTVYVKHVTIRYDLHDAATGATIFSREDVRDEDGGDREDMYELSVRSFFRELKLE